MGFVPHLGLDSFYAEMREAKVSIQGMSCAELLRRDYKEFDTLIGKLGMSTVTCSVYSLIEKGSRDFGVAVREYIKQQNLTVFIVMGVSGEGESFKRDGMIVTSNRDVMNAFQERAWEKYACRSREGISDDVLRDAMEGYYCWFFEQGDTSASRKQIAPLIRDVMHSVVK